MSHLFGAAVCSHICLDRKDDSFHLILFAALPKNGKNEKKERKKEQKKERMNERTKGRTFL